MSASEAGVAALGLVAATDLLSPNDANAAIESFFARAGETPRMEETALRCR